MKYDPLIKLAEKSSTFLRFIENKKRPKNKNKVYLYPWFVILYLGSSFYSGFFLFSVTNAMFSSLV